MREPNQVEALPRSSGAPVIELETRLAPAPVLFASAGGSVYERVGNVYEFRQRAFESDVPASLATYGDLVYVGAGVGGGPRIVGYDRGWHVVSSVFVGDPNSRSGIDLLGFDRPTLGLVADDPAVQSYLDRIPPIPALAPFSLPAVHVLPSGGDPVGFFGGPDFSVNIRAPYAPRVLHEVGHWVGVVAFGDQSEAFAWRWMDWVNGAPDPTLDSWAVS